MYADTLPTVRNQMGANEIVTRLLMEEYGQLPSKQLESSPAESAAATLSTKETAVVAKTQPTEQDRSFVHAFNLLVSAQMQLNGGDRQAAIAWVARREPALHALYLRASNPTSGAFR